MQMNFLLHQITSLLPGVNEALRATIERADERSAFSLELFDLQTWTLRPLASSLNLQWRPDPALVRFIARSTVLQLIGVATFKLLHLERGYWLPLTMLVVLQPEYGATRMRAGQRVIGTFAGSVLASIVLWLGLPPAVLSTAMAFTIAGFAFWLKRNYAIAVFFITLFVVLITEISTHVTVAFTLERLAATAAGGVLAMIAASLFWPVWERQRLPTLLSCALRENKNYLRVLGQRVAAGGSYDAEVIAAKRAVELANGIVFASLQRMSADPKNQQSRLEEAATLANGNQRLTHALTVVALHLAPGSPLSRPELTRFVDLAEEVFETLAAAVANEPLDHGSTSRQTRRSRSTCAAGAKNAWHHRAGAGSLHPVFTVCDRTQRHVDRGNAGAEVATTRKSARDSACPRRVAISFPALDLPAPHTLFFSDESFSRSCFAHRLLPVAA